MTDIKAMELFVSKLLRGGVLASGVLMVMGLGLLATTGDMSSPYGVPTVEWFIRGSPFLEPSHVLYLGFLALIGTPLVRIMASTYTYYRSGDTSFTLITGVVLVVLVVSMVLGVG